MAYKVIDSGWFKTFNNWWDLIDYIKDKEYNIAHNSNDIYVYYDCRKFKLKPSELSYEEEIVKKAITLLTVGKSDYKEINKYTYKRNIFVYDNDDRIINLSEIRKSIAIYKPKNKKYIRFRNYFRYRYDPVPGIRVYKCNKCKSVRKNKSYAAKLSEYVDLFPNDSSIKRSAFFVSKWDDEFLYRKTEKNWKYQSKKRKQWM